MKPINAILALSVLLAGVTLAQDQPAAQSAANPSAKSATAPDLRALMQNLRDDLVAAKANAKLTEKQSADLDQAITTLQTARQSRTGGQQGDRQQIRAAMMTIRDIAQSDALRPEDKQKIQADVKALREARQTAGNRGARRRSNL